MDRREFLQVAAVTGVMAATGVVTGSPVQDPGERDGAVRVRRGRPRPAPRGDEGGSRGPPNRSPGSTWGGSKECDPLINSIIELNPDAIAIARSLDAERKDKGSRGPLHGVPVLIKDNIDTADRMHTTAGSLALADSIALKDSFVADRLRKAGAVILGKTNLSEWANFRSTRSTSGWSGRGGQTNNPYALDRNPCGSSSGSGAAVSANLCAVAVGTETDGSIVCPATTNGVVGIKPTVGLIGRTGIVPISHSQDTAGPLTRTVRDAANLLTALAGIDPDDAAAKNAQGKIRDRLCPRFPPIRTDSKEPASGSPGSSLDSTIGSTR